MGRVWPGDWSRSQALKGWLSWAGVPRLRTSLLPRVQLACKGLLGGRENGTVKRQCGGQKRGSQPPSPSPGKTYQRTFTKLNSPPPPRRSPATPAAAGFSPRTTRCLGGTSRLGTGCGRWGGRAARGLGWGRDRPCPWPTRPTRAEPGALSGATEESSFLGGCQKEQPWRGRTAVAAAGGPDPATVTAPHRRRSGSSSRCAVPADGVRRWNLKHSCNFLCACRKPGFGRPPSARASSAPQVAAETAGAVKAWRRGAHRAPGLFVPAPARAVFGVLGVGAWLWNAEQGRKGHATRTTLQKTLQYLGIRS